MVILLSLPLGLRPGHAVDSPFADSGGDASSCATDIDEFYGEHKEQNRNQVELTMSTVCPSEPFDNPEWSDTTWLVWSIDITGDDNGDFTVEYTVNGQPRAAVYDRARNRACDAVATWDRDRGMYGAWFGRGCLGNPASFRLQAGTVRNGGRDDVAPDRGFGPLIAYADSPPPPPPPPPPAPARSGYWMLGAKGNVYPFGDARHFGDAPVGANTAVDIEATPSFDGYWVVDDGGNVFAFGDAPYAGGARGLPAGERVTALSGTRSGRGYWLFTDKGRAFGYGDAVNHMHGDMGGIPLNGPVLDAARTSSGEGYYMVAADGGIFAFGDARFHGSMGGHRLNQPVESLVPDADGTGYWLVAADGGVFAFEAPFRGSTGNLRLNKPVTGMVRFGNGYLMVAEDGGVFNFSDKPFHGSLGDHPPPVPIVNVTALNG